MIDILMATYNGELYIKEQLESIINQTYNNWKLYIRDDGSKDNTVNIIKKYISDYPEKIFLIEDNKNGLGAKNNFKELMKYSTNDYCMFSDQDDIWLENKIEITLNKMLEMETRYSKDTPLLVHTDVKVIDANGNILDNSFWNYQSLNGQNTSINKLIVENVVTGCTMMLNKQLVEISKEIPKESVMHDAWIALVASGLGEIYSLKTPTMLYRQHDKNEVGAKRSKGIKFVISNIDRNKIEKSITNSIEQAKKFFEMYKNDIDNTDRIYLEKFINIRKLNFVKRKIIAIKYKLYREDIKRRIGYLIFI